MKKPEFFVGIDGGGTKTEAVIADRHGDVAAKQTAGPTNFQIIGVEKAAAVIADLVEACCAAASCSPD